MWHSSMTRCGLAAFAAFPLAFVPRGLRAQISEPIASVSTVSNSPWISASISARTRSSRPGTPGVSHRRLSRSMFSAGLEDLAFAAGLVGGIAISDAQGSSFPTRNRQNSVRRVGLRVPREGRGRRWRGDPSKPRSGLPTQPHFARSAAVNIRPVVSRSHVLAFPCLDS